MIAERILVIDDSPDMVRLCQQALERGGFEVKGALSGEKGLQLLKEQSPACPEPCLEPCRRGSRGELAERGGFDLVLLDIMLPDRHGLGVLSAIREIDPEMAVVVITAHGTMEIAIEALKLGAQDFLLKPFTPAELVASVGNVLEKERLIQENQRLKARLPILEIGKALVSEVNLERLTQLALETVQQELGADQASLMLLDEGRQELFISAALGLPDEVVTTTRLKVGQGLAGLAVQKREPMLVPEQAESDPALQAQSPELVEGLLGRSDVGSAICMPLMLRGRVLGVLNASRSAGSVLSGSTERSRRGLAEVSSKGSAPFRQDDVDLLSILSGQIAVAIENAQLFEQAQGEITERKRAIETLRESEERYRRLVGLSFDVIAIHREGKIVYINAAGAELFGASSPAELIGKPILDFVHPDYLELAKARMLQTMEGKVVPLVEEKLIRFDGTSVDAEVVEVPVTYQGQPAVQVVARDVTERKQAEEALRESEERFRALFEDAPLCIFELDLTQTPPTITRANRRAEQVYGWSSQEFASVPLDKIIPPDAISEMVRIMDALRVGEAITIESANQRRDGSVFPVRISAASKAGFDPSRVIVTIEDITAEKERRSEEEAIAEERRRIAQEIHDGLAQTLAALRFRARQWHRLVDADPAQMHAELDELREILSDSIVGVRRSIFALRPIALEEHGFFPALRQFAAGFGEPYRLRVNLDISGPKERLPTSLELTLLRVIQEALNNVGKHAQASAVWITLDLEASDAVTLTIRDDGQGFDLSCLSQAVRDGHLGLKQMRERVEKTHGELLIQSQPGQGTEVRVVLPLTTGQF